MKMRIRTLVVEVEAEGDPELVLGVLGEFVRRGRAAQAAVDAAMSVLKPLEDGTADADEAPSTPASPVTPVAPGEQKTEQLPKPRQKD